MTRQGIACYDATACPRLKRCAHDPVSGKPLQAWSRDDAGIYRPATGDVLSGILGRLRNGRANSYMAILCGPPGNGKTVLLRWLDAEATAANITTVALVPQRLVSPAGLTATVRTATRRFARFREWISPLKAEYRGFKLGVAGADEPSPLIQILKRCKGGLLLTLDVAHGAPPDVLGHFLNAAQLAGRTRPIAVVLAGTPGLEATMRAAHASFWSRGRKLRIGLLGETSAREALARPFQNAGIEADDEAVVKLACAADNYPYFLQLYGGAAWTVVETSGGRAFLPKHVAPTLAAADRARRDDYFDRFNEFDDAGPLPLARRVAAAFFESAEASASGRLSNAALDHLIADGVAGTKKEFLVTKGYVWQDGPNDHEERAPEPSPAGAGSDQRRPRRMRMPSSSPLTPADQ